MNEPGRNLQIRIGDGGNPETFQEVGRFQLRRLKLNQTVLDATDRDSIDRWRELVASGVRSARIEGAGNFKNSAAEERLRADWFNGNAPNFQFQAARWGTLLGAFHITELDLRAALGEKFAFAVILESTGPLSWS